MLYNIGNSTAEMDTYCGLRFIPFPKRVRSSLVRTVDDAKRIFPQYNFHKHFLFRNKVSFMRFAHALGICVSTSSKDAGLDFVLSNKSKVGKIACLLIYICRFRMKLTDLSELERNFVCFEFEKLLFLFFFVITLFGVIVDVIFELLFIWKLLIFF